MSAITTSQSFVTLEEYYKFEAASLGPKHDYDNGKIVAMSGGSLSHSRIMINVAGELRNRLKGKSCEALESNFKVGFPGRTYSHYPDASVICGGVQLDPRDSTKQTFINPTAIIEVLSPSTSDFDRSTKFDRYRQLASFREYVIIFQDRPEVQTFYRQDDTTWLMQTFSGLAGDVPLKSLGIALPLSEIFDRVTFEPPTEPAAGDVQPGQAGQQNS